MPLLRLAVRGIDRFAELCGVAIAWLMVPGLAVSDSVQQSWQIDRMWNDGITALWGAPIPLSNSEQTHLAASCALQMVRRTADLTQQWSSTLATNTKVPKVELRFGVNTGEALVNLAARLVATGGALVTELAIGHPVGRPDFARRNRLIAGLAEAVVVVEAPDRSGALLTASAALELGRDLYAVPGPIDAASSRGCNRLIADSQAALLTSSAGLLAQLRAIRRPDLPPVVTGLSEAEAMVLQRILARSGAIEELLARTDLMPGSMAAALTMLEARGLVTTFGGVTFHPTLAARRLDRRT